MRDQRNAMATISDLQAQIEQHKERSNRLKQTVQEANKEAEAARGELAGRDDEIRELKSKLSSLRSVSLKFWRVEHLFNNKCWNNT